MTKPTSQLSNFKGKIHKLTKEDASKGGKNSTWYRIKKCSKKCPYFDTCVHVNISKQQYKGKCFVKTMAPRLQKAFVAFKSGKESKMDEVLLDSLHQVMHEDKPKDFVSLGMKLKESIYGKKIKQAISNDGETEFVVRFKSDKDEKDEVDENGSEEES